jgi:hypothetical protein
VLVVYWSLSGGPVSDVDRYVDQLRRVAIVHSRHPTLKGVIVGGAPNRLLDSPDTSSLLAPLLDHDSIYLEMVYPVYVGLEEDYPFPSALDAVRGLYDRLGPRRLVWGSDLPNVERHCTYRQSLPYLTTHARFLPPEDLSLITGGNLARLFDVPLL